MNCVDPTGLLGERILNGISDSFQNIDFNGLAAATASIPFVGAGTEAVEDIGEAGTYVIGKYPDYVNLAQQIEAQGFEANIFNLPADEYKALQASGGADAANQAFLDSAIKSGTIISSSYPSEAVAGDSFGKELEYLTRQGIDINKIPVIKS